MDSGKELGGLLDDRTVGFDVEEGGDDSGDEAAELSEAERLRNRRRCRVFIDGQRWVRTDTESGKAPNEEIIAIESKEGRSTAEQGMGYGVIFLFLFSICLFVDWMAC